MVSNGKNGSGGAGDASRGTAVAGADSAAGLGTAVAGAVGDEGDAGLDLAEAVRDADRRAEPPPAPVRDLAEACVRFVERAVGVKLDYEPETLPILDHYLAGARSAAQERPEARALVAHAAGAYFGEVVRRRHPSWWRLASDAHDDPASWRIELEPVYLSFSPVELVADALFLPLEGDPDPEGRERLELEDEDRSAVAARLADLPEVSEDELRAPSTWIEVIDIAVDAIRARRLGEGDADAILGPSDYESPTS